MALEESSGGIPATMLVGPTGYGGTPYPVFQSSGGNNGGWGGDGWWVIILLLALGGWGNGMGGGFGGFGNTALGMDFPGSSTASRISSPACPTASATRCSTPP